MNLLRIRLGCPTGSWRSGIAVFFGFVSPFLFSNCANSSHVILYQHMNVGLNAGTHPETGNIHARFGVRNEFAGIIPTVFLDGKDGKERQAASAFVASRVRISSVFEAPEIEEIIATGEAAVRLARHPNAVDVFTTPLPNLRVGE